MKNNLTIDEAIEAIVNGSSVNEVADKVIDSPNILSTYPWQIRLESPELLDGAKVLLKDHNIPCGDNKVDTLTFQHSADRDGASQLLHANGINVKGIFQDNE
jgi:hypothetical protein